MSLKDRLIRQIRMDGPIPVSAYMQTCLHDPKDGYYARGAGLGRDFITAPETSQMFGELLGLWAVEQWQAMGNPESFNLVELGPGRGTLMADALRAAKAFKDDRFWNGMSLTLVEASPALRGQQAQKLERYRPAFITGLHELPDQPTILLANEFLDCLPVRQFVQEGEAWRERVVGLSEAETLSFGIDRSDLAEETASSIPGKQIRTEAELQPGLERLVDELTQLAQSGHKMRALFIDYGPADGAPADTLRAYKDGEQVDPLASPGEADLTVDVDFGRLSRLARNAGLSVSGPVPQGAFLGQLGLQARLNALIKASPEEADNLFQGAQKLVGPDQMGQRFKTVCLSSAGLPDPAGFASG